MLAPSPGQYFSSLEGVEFNPSLLESKSSTFTNLFHKFRQKKWFFQSYQQDEYFIGLGLVDLKYLNFIFCYLIHRSTGQVFSFEKKIPPSASFILPQTPFQDFCLWRKKNEMVQIQYCKEKSSWETIFHLELQDNKNKKYLLSGQINADQIKEGLHLLYEFSKSKGRYSYTHKQTSMPLNGRLKFRTDKIIFTPQSSFGSIDWTRGIFYWKTKWKWASISSKEIGVNLSQNIYQNKDPKKGENVFWYQQKACSIGEVEFRLPKDGLENAWVIQNKEKTLSLLFFPEVPRIEKTSIGILSSHFIQAYGKFYGYIYHSHFKKKITIDGLSGIAEDHSSKW